MLPAKKLTEELAHTVMDLPPDQQREVYDFAAFLKSRAKTTVLRSSPVDLVGIIDGPADLAQKHDEISLLSQRLTGQPLYVNDYS
jgi:hypothetical protein